MTLDDFVKKYNGKQVEVAGIKDNLDFLTMLEYYRLMEFKINSPKYGGLKALVDDKNKSLINHLCVNKCGQFLYLRNNLTKKYLHREIMGFPKGMVINHKNRDTLDNRRENLEIVTIQENLRNQKRPNNKTGYTGVAVFKGGKFSAQIKHNYKKIHLGLFKTIEEAYQARKNAERKYWGI